MIKFKNESGSIGMDRAVFARIAVETAGEFNDRITFSNAKGKPVKVGITGREKLGFIEVSDSGAANVDLKIYMILRFGTSVSGITKAYSARLRENVKDITGVTVDHIDIVINGVKSRNVVKRELEIHC